ncbi:hypothetical protein [Erwinia persicina]|uniref:hypothetical protein n=1 Tax=Erwinia persicina TaxID=55211 RepID=UPI00177D07D1|nr:hypothetical protein [Erwinia persicina]MBD8168632.1 hypothetical protein [Erwinia persicina]
MQMDGISLNHDNPKLTFVYPTFIRVGMIANGPFLPDIGWQVSQFPMKMMFYVSVGLMLNSKRPYSYDIDLLFDGKSLTPEDAPVMESRFINTAVSNRDDFVAISTNLLENVVMPEGGLYTIKARLFAGKANSSEKELIHECLGYFTLAEDWMNNEIKQTD